MFAVKDFLQNLLNWHGRLSRAGYWLAWLFVLIADMVMRQLFIMTAVLFSHAVFTASFFIVGLLWNVVMYFALLFAAMRRYHDSGKPGWLALIFDGFGRLCVAGGLICLLLAILIAGFSGLQAAANGAANRLLNGALTTLLIGAVLCIIDFLFLIRRSDAGENAYGVQMR